MIDSIYLSDVLDRKELSKIIKRLTRKAISIQKKIKFNGLVATGISGLLVLTPLALELKLPFAVVRKSKKNHSGCRVEGEDNITKYLIIDDFMDSGDTIFKIYKDMSDFNASLPAGVLFYDMYPDDMADTFTGYYEDYYNYLPKRGKIKTLLDLNIPLFTARRNYGR
jgi:adenine/guanine phosphoribosyltransferase-like PRPP-binding protein